MANSVYSAAMRPVQQAVGGFLANGINAVMGGLMPFADGGAFAQGRVMPFAKGGVVTAPTTFPMRGGRGLMGEAGPELVLLHGLMGAVSNWDTVLPLFGNYSKACALHFPILTAHRSEVRVKSLAATANVKAVQARWKL